MSHFTVLCVLGTDIDPSEDEAVNDRLQELLAPYDENEEVESYRVYEHERILEYASYTESFEAEFGAAPKSPERGTYKESEHEKVWDDYKHAQHQYGQRILDRIGGAAMAKQMTVEDGEKYGWDDQRKELYQISTYNPESKWDWWVLGGRWKGYFMPKPGSPAAIGRSGVFNNESMFPGGVDAIRVKDIDLAAMTSTVLAQRQDRLDDFDRDTDTNRTMAAARALGWGEVDLNDPNWRSDYLSAPVSFATHAWLSDKGWDEAGKMGWFGVTVEEKVSRGAWDAGWMKALADLDPETTIAVVDCHI